MQPESSQGRTALILIIVSIAARAVVSVITGPLLAVLGGIGAIVVLLLNAAALIVTIVGIVIAWIAIVKHRDRSLVLLIVAVVASVLTLFSLPSLL
ncbi:hypothetical protein OVN18_08630 [Microcella daejeonensis]|uniref:Uncharacterized protein n=1 Tax=Microcella daejeonensis TaxID=2994971 RepID=A0A9E8SAG4_9MICO|nr:hypothetical protein [Microcella daejeonensis]WAB80632.1 hypothetical protein OVN18_08630 [Microcella daejeonensis]WAB82817.1 hypothetical protein OVN20_06745 [Microcella daejeonensis]